MAEKSNARPAENKKSFGQKFVHACKECVRKFIVSLKRRPQYIPLAVFLIAFLLYSFNLTDISDTTALLGGANMGLAAFAVMLFSMLSLVCFMNAFPYRKPVNKPMLILMFLMQAIIIFADWYYLRGIGISGVGLEWPDYIYYAQYYLQMHIVVLIIGVVLTVLLPVYSKLLRKINTNIEVEGNTDMGAIDLAGDS